MIYTIRPLLHKLLSKHLIEKPSDDIFTKTPKNIIFTDLNGHWILQKYKFTEQACLLDAHFKVLSFLSQREKNEIISNVKEETHTRNNYGISQWSTDSSS